MPVASRMDAWRQREEQKGGDPPRRRKSSHRKGPMQIGPYFFPLPAGSVSLSFVISTGGCGGFLASVRDIGVTGQQQQASTVSEEDAVRGGAGGFLSSFGGATKPCSPVPSPAKMVPAQRVAARAVLITFWAAVVFMEKRGMDSG